MGNYKYPLFRTPLGDSAPSTKKTQVDEGLGMDLIVYLWKISIWRIQERIEVENIYPTTRNSRGTCKYSSRGAWKSCL